MAGAATEDALEPRSSRASTLPSEALHVELAVLAEALLTLPS